MYIYGHNLTDIIEFKFYKILHAHILELRELRI